MRYILHICGTVLWLAAAATCITVTAGCGSGTATSPPLPQRTTRTIGSLNLSAVITSESYNANAHDVEFKGTLSLTNLSAQPITVTQPLPIATYVGGVLAQTNGSQVLYDTPSAPSNGGYGPGTGGGIVLNPGQSKDIAILLGFTGAQGRASLYRLTVYLDALVSEPNFPQAGVPATALPPIVVPAPVNEGAV